MCASKVLTVCSNMQKSMFYNIWLVDFRKLKIDYYSCWWIYLSKIKSDIGPRMHKSKSSIWSICCSVFCLKDNYLVRKLKNFKLLLGAKFWPLFPWLQGWRDECGSADIPCYNNPETFYEQTIWTGHRFHTYLCRKPI